MESAFERELVEMTQITEFRKTDTFQRTLNQDVKSVRSSNKAFIPADKTRNMYEMDKDTHDKLLHENITKSYKKCDNNTYNKINKEAKQIATNSRNPGQNYYPRQETSLYHHERIIRKTLLTPKCRLMNPAKSIIGCVSKQILKIINETTNTNSVINWFKSFGRREQPQLREV